MNRSLVNLNNNRPHSTLNKNVAVLRGVLQSRLELKSPSGNIAKSVAPPWTNVSTGYEPECNVSRAVEYKFGRVLDGPVNPEKYFQGVPPPSFNQLNNVSKPPAPPPKLAPSSISKTVSEARPLIDEVDDGASIISSCISTFGESSEIAGFSAAAEQRDLYEKYKKKLLETMLETEKEDNHSILSPGVFSNVSLTPFGHSKVTGESLREQNFRKSTHSLDLESSEILVKPKTPTPYSSKTIEHYGTIRKKHRPFKSDMEENHFVKNSTLHNETQSVSSNRDNEFTEITANSISQENNQRLNTTLETAFRALATINTIKSDAVPIANTDIYPIGEFKIESKDGNDLAQLYEVEKVETETRLLRKDINQKPAFTSLNDIRFDSESLTKPVQLATVIFDFRATTERELSLKRGETLKIIRHIDENWIEGEKDGNLGIFPSSYVHLNEGSLPGRQKMRAMYSCHARNKSELSFKKGDVIDKIRTVDTNWIEGMNEQEEIGLIPKCYFELVSMSTENQCEMISPQGVGVSGTICYQAYENGINFESGDYSKDSKPCLKVEDPDFDYRKEPHVSPKTTEVYRVKYSYDPDRMDELQLLNDDIIFVVEKCDDGWFIGTSLQTGKFGIFPGNYVTKHKI